MNPSPRMNQSRRIVAIVPNAHINGVDDNCTVYYDDGTYQEWQVGKPLYLLEQYAKRMALLNHKDLEPPPFYCRNPRNMDTACVIGMCLSEWPVIQRDVIKMD